ncbi:MAG: hypothetical protein ACTHN0_06695 [Aquihabitans sp.]
MELDASDPDPDDEPSSSDDPPPHANPDSGTTEEDPTAGESGLPPDGDDPMGGPAPSG